jgi:hypothetical protein
MTSERSGGRKECLTCAGDCAIFTITKLVFVVKTSDDFESTAIYVHNTFLIQSAPESNYGAKGIMSLYHNPIIQLDEAHCMLCFPLCS